MESESSSDWELWIAGTLLVNAPSLVEALVALVPMDVSLVGVRVSMDIEASSNDISDVPSGSLEPSGLLEVG